MTSTAAPLSSTSSLVSASDASSSHSSSAPPHPQPGAQTPSRLSRLNASQENSSKRLSTASNPSREAPPTPDHAPPPTSNPTSPPAGAAKQASPRNSPTPAEASNSSSPPSSRHKIPSFPPPQASRISIMSISSNNRDSFHPQFASSLPYTSVRDFAYPSLHPLHYGPTKTSGVGTPASQRASGFFESGSGPTGWYHGGGRRLSDPTQPSQDTFAWDDAALPRQRPSNQPPPLNFSDGPPWSEDEDLQSPVVMPKHGPTHRKHKSTAAHMQSHHRHQSKNAFTPTTLHHFAGNRDEKDWDRPEVENGLSSSRGYYTRFSNASELADGEPGGELYRHPEETEYDPDNPGYYHDQDYSDGEGDYDDDSEYNARFSTDYQFTIASPDEEMHGKAVALFDFARENENELPLVEGQLVLVSYRHGMGWLVAEDPKTGESGLVPEEYVRLFKFMHSDATQEMNPSLLAEVAAEGDRPVSPATSNNGHQPPVISTFSTSSEDVTPLPLQHLHHPDEYYAHVGTPTTPSSKDRLEQIRREQDRAVREMIDSDTPRLGSARFEVKRNRKSEEKGNEAEKRLSLAEAPTGRKSGGDDVFFDAREEQGVDFREK